MSEKFYSEHYPSMSSLDKQAKEATAKHVNTELTDKVKELNATYKSIMDSYTEAELAGNTELAEQLLKDANEITKELDRIDPQTKKGKEAAHKISDVENKIKDEIDKLNTENINKSKFN